MFSAIFLLHICQLLVKAQEIQWNKFHQTSYDVELHRLEVEWYDKSYINVERFDLARYNRSTPRSVYLSIDVLRDFDKSIMMSVELFKFRSNRYLAFPDGARVDACKEFNRNSFNIQKYTSKYSNFKECPPKKGHYVGNGVYIDTDLFPPFLPIGDYKVAINTSSGHDLVMQFAVYGSLKNKPIKWP